MSVIWPLRSSIAESYYRQNTPQLVLVHFFGPKTKSTEVKIILSLPPVAASTTSIEGLEHLPKFLHSI